MEHSAAGFFLHTMKMKSEMSPGYAKGVLVLLAGYLGFLNNHWRIKIERFLGMQAFDKHIG